MESAVCLSVDCLSTQEENECLPKFQRYKSLVFVLERRVERKDLVISITIIKILKTDHFVLLGSVCIALVLARIMSEAYSFQRCELIPS